MTALSLTAVSYLILYFSVFILLLPNFCLPQIISVSPSPLFNIISLWFPLLFLSADLYFSNICQNHFFSVMPFPHWLFPFSLSLPSYSFHFLFGHYNPFNGKLQAALAQQKQIFTPWKWTCGMQRRMGHTLTEKHSLSLPSPLYHSHAYCKDIFYSSQAAAGKQVRMSK